MSKLNIGSKQKWYPLILGVAISFVMFFVLLLSFSLIISLADISMNSASIFAIVILCISAFVGGVICARLSESKALLFGAASGALFYFVVALISVIVTRSGLTSVFFIRLIATLVSSCLGAFIYVLKANNRKFV